MSDTKFTPGPWTAEYDDQWRDWAIHSPSMPILSPIVRLYDSDDNAKYDAALIAAAPELYEALVEARWLLRAIFGQDGNYPDEKKILAQADATLKKARGES